MNSTAKIWGVSVRAGIWQGLANREPKPGQRYAHARPGLRSTPIVCLRVERYSREQRLLDYDASVILDFPCQPLRQWSVPGSWR